MCFKYVQISFCDRAGCGMLSVNSWMSTRVNIKMLLMIACLISFPGSQNDEDHFDSQWFLMVYDEKYVFCSTKSGPWWFMMDHANISYDFNAWQVTGNRNQAVRKLSPVEWFGNTVSPSLTSWSDHGSCWMIASHNFPANPCISIRYMHHFSSSTWFAMLKHVVTTDYSWFLMVNSGLCVYHKMKFKDI